MVTINMPVKQKQTCASSLPWPVQWKCWIAQYQGSWRQWHVWDRRLPEVSTPRWQLEQSSWPTSTSEYIICKHQTHLFYEGQVYSSCAQSCCWFQSCYKRKFLPLRCPDTVGWATGRECRVGMLVVLIRQRVLHILVSASCHYSAAATSTISCSPEWFDTLVPAYQDVLESGCHKGCRCNKVKLHIFAVITIPRNCIW